MKSATIAISCVIILISLFIFGHSAFANNIKVDSLLQIVAATRSNFGKAAAFNLISDELKVKDWEESLCYARDAYNISVKNKYPAIASKALFNIGYLTYYHINRNAALKYFEKGLTYAQQAGDLELTYWHLMELGKWHTYRSKDSLKVVFHFERAASVAQKAKNYVNAGRAYAKLSSYYANQKHINECEKQLENARQFYDKADKSSSIVYYYCDIGDRVWQYNMSKGMYFYLLALDIAPRNPQVKLSLGQAYRKIGKPKLAITYLKDAIDTFRGHENVRRLGLAMAYLAEIYADLGNFKLADSLSNENIALLSTRSIREKNALPLTYIIKGFIKENSGNKEEAIKYYEKGLKIAEMFNSSRTSVLVKLSIGKNYIDMDNAKAKLYCNDALEQSKEYNYFELSANACDCLHTVFNIEKDFEKALNYFHRKVSIEDSIQAKRVEYTFDINSELAKKENEIVLERNIRQEQLKSENTINKILMTALIFGTLLIFILANGLHRIIKQKGEIIEKTALLENTNTQLKHSNEELERFAYIASHDLKAPLLSIINFNNILKDKLQNTTDPIIENSIRFIEQSGERMSKLIKDVLELSRLSSDKISITKEAVDINLILKEVSKSILSKMEKPQIKINLSSNKIVHWNSTNIFVLFQNIIENGLKYNESDKPTMHIFDTETAPTYNLYFQDNGIGIDHKFFDKIFLMFNRLHRHDDYEGTGLGLYTCKKIVTEFNGELNLESKPGSGTTFEIKFPKRMILNGKL